jgi:Ni,Fe-hydrogenase I small subunit
MKVERFTVQACCGNTSIMLKTDQPLTKDFLGKLVSHGFNEHPHFTQAGILYVDNLDFILTGPIGSDRLQVKCKKRDCEQNLNNLEALLLQLG